MWRHVFVTRLVQSGATVKVAQELARHSTPVLTLGRYSHIGLHDTSAALDALPSLTPAKTNPQIQPQQLRKTGTDDLPSDPPTPPTPKTPSRHLDTSLDTACIAGRIWASSDGAGIQASKEAQVPVNPSNSRKSSDILSQHADVAQWQSNGFVSEAHLHVLQLPRLHAISSYGSVVRNVPRSNDLKILPDLY